MIGLLTGRVVHEEVTGSVLLDVRGVGYELVCPVGTLGRAERSEQGDVTLHVHTNLRQDSLELFGFSTSDERLAFRQLVNVPGVGPRTAIAVLSALPSADLSEAVEREDKVRLAKVPGIGKKTAERLVLELRGKLIPTLALGKHIDASPQKDASSKLVLALVGLGYKPIEAERAAKNLPPEAAGEELSLQLRRALRFLAS